MARSSTGLPYKVDDVVVCSPRIIICNIRRLLRGFLCLSSVISVLAACSSLPRTPYTAADDASAQVLNLSDLRRYTDEPASTFVKDTDGRFGSGPLIYLALSGGGADGAYGAGVLNGWTATGKRPSFSVVSGVSTGALIAPFAFLGPAYDGTLKEVYTSGVAESLINAPNPLNVLFGSGLFANARLRDLVARYVDQQMLSAIAAQYERGRDLYVVTTNLDTQRTVMWDMGRIAKVGTPQALTLFRDVLAASASLPVVFSPILIDAEANGRHFQEMHVDGGVTAPILTLPEAFLLRRAKLTQNLHMDLYVLINDKIGQDFEVVPDETLDIATRSSATVTKAQIRSVLYETYDFARRNKFRFNLTYIGEDAPLSSDAGSFGFNTGYMRTLYDYGYQKAKSSALWSKEIPSDDIPARYNVVGR
jgi:predicted acylesterase/phospholipase RssA